MRRKAVQPFVIEQISVFCRAELASLSVRINAGFAQHFITTPGGSDYRSLSTLTRIYADGGSPNDVGLIANDDCLATLSGHLVQVP